MRKAPLAVVADATARQTVEQVAERLRQYQALLEKAHQDKAAVEEAARAERQDLFEERRQLEHRLEEADGPQSDSASTSPWS